MRWTPEEELLVYTYIEKAKGDLEGFPAAEIAQKLGRTRDAVGRKARRLVEAYYNWTPTEENGAFHYYLKGSPTKEILDRLRGFGSQVSADALEFKLKQMRALLESELRVYAEEHNLLQKRKPTLDTLLNFVEYKKNPSTFTKSKLHRSL